MVPAFYYKQFDREDQVRHTHRGIIAGKLNGHIPAQTPSGSRMLKVSIPLETFDTYSPICSVPIPQACSTTSIWLRVQNQSGIINGQHKKEFYQRKGQQSSIWKGQHFKHMKRAFWTTIYKSAVNWLFMQSKCENHDTCETTQIMTNIYE